MIPPPMIRYTTLIALLLLAMVKASVKAPAQTPAPINVKEAFAVAAKQYEGMLAAHLDITKFPQSTNPDGSPRDMKSEWWCSGFFGGSLWYLYEQTNDPKWKQAAEKWTTAVEKEQYNKGTHDLGFMIYCPYGNGYRLTKNAAYRPIMLTSANSLVTCHKR